MSFGQPVLRGLFRKEDSSCDVQLFIVGEVRELDHLAVTKEWWSDGAERIGHTDERNAKGLSAR